MRSNQPADVTDVLEDRAFRAFHTFMRASRAYMDANVYDETWHSYRRALGDQGRHNGDGPQNADDAFAVLDALPAYQLYAWMYRHLQRFKYNYPDFGIQPKAEGEAGHIQRELDAAADTAIAAVRCASTPM